MDRIELGMLAGWLSLTTTTTEDSPARARQNNNKSINGRRGTAIKSNGEEKMYSFVENMAVDVVRAL